jgi:hypothetical protein
MSGRTKKVGKSNLALILGRDIHVRLCMDNRTRTSPLNSNDSNLHPHGQKENSKKDVTQAHTKRVVRLILGVVDTYSTLGDP